MTNPCKTVSVERHVVLVAPEIHWNTGNIGRTCLGAGACLHLVRPLGFSLGSREIKRAGLDYWPKVDLRVWEDFSQMRQSMGMDPAQTAVFTKSGGRDLWEMPSARRLFLVFGSETRGLPDSLLRRFRHCTYRIPISNAIRSLNLSTAVGIALYESLRPDRFGERRSTDS
jgi:tRNA (cytidine/uridine-2'-O-)-methyltransferase